MHCSNVNAPELVNKYQLLEKIGNGTYANVYKAKNICLDSDDTAKRVIPSIVAIKRIHCASRSHRLTELQILDELRGEPNFPIMYGILLDRNSGAVSIVMNYFPHLPFHKYCHTLNEEQTIQYIYAVLRCIYCLSSRGFVHRDIKPSNFLYHPFPTSSGNTHHNNQRNENKHGSKKCCGDSNFLLVDFGTCQQISELQAKHHKHHQVSQTVKPPNTAAMNKNKKTTPKTRTRTRTRTRLGTMSARPQTTTTRKRAATMRPHLLSKQKPTKIKTQAMCHIPDAERSGTRGFRAPEIVFKSNNQDSRVDVYNAGLMLACIMFGCEYFFCPQNDMQQLAQFIPVYGYDTVWRVGQLLNRELTMHWADCEILQRYYYNHKNSDIIGRAPNADEDVAPHMVVASGFDKRAQQPHGHFSTLYNHKKGKWKAQSSDVVMDSQCDNDVDTEHNLSAVGMDREWSAEMFDLLDQLTSFDPRKRPKAEDAWRHPIFRHFD